MQPTRLTNHISVKRASAAWPSLRIVVAVLMASLLTTTTAYARGPMNAQKARVIVTNRGIGKYLRVKQADGTEITGVIAAIRDDGFDVVQKQTIQPTPVLYAQVTELHNESMSTGATIGTGVAIGLISVLALIVVVAIVVVVLVH